MPLTGKSAKIAPMPGVQQVAYVVPENPALLAEVDRRFFGAAPVDLDAAVESYIEHIAGQLRAGARLHPLIRPMLGLYHGRPGARLFRRHLSEYAVRPDAGINVLREALAFVRRREAA